MYLKNEDITAETPLSLLTVGQFSTILRRLEKAEIPSQKPVPEIFGLDVLCELTGYSKPTIYGKTSKNKIPHFKRENTLFFKRDDIFSWMTSNRIETVEEKTRKLDEHLINGRS